MRNAIALCLASVLLAACAGGAPSGPRGGWEHDPNVAWTPPTKGSEVAR